MSIVMVVLSPPGRTMPSSPSRSSRVRTNRVRAPDFSRARTCSAKAPCIARTPMRGFLLRDLPTCVRFTPRTLRLRREFEGAPVCARRAAELPAPSSEQLFLGDGGDLKAVHRLPESGGDFGQE